MSRLKVAIVAGAILLFAAGDGGVSRGQADGDWVVFGEGPAGCGKYLTSSGSRT
jgi:hypothetical protein